MEWAIGFICLKTGKVELYGGEDTDLSDPAYGPDIHIVPCDPIKGNKADLTFGAHEFTRECYCHPRTKPCSPHKTLVLHNGTVN
jgi:hypothetical protein